MDSNKTVSVTRAFILFLLIALVGCESELPADSVDSNGPLRIIGSPTGSFYIGRPYTFEFGVAGGQGPYKYRYLREAPEGGEFEDPDAPNYLDASLEVLDDAKAAFFFHVVPELPDDVSFTEFNSVKSAFYIEVTDGVDTIVVEYV